MLDVSVVGTCAIMDWCDKHADEKLTEATFFKSTNDTRGLVASDVTEEDISATLLLYPYDTWFEVENGWQRIHPCEDMALWYCKKGDRIICITD